MQILKIYRNFVDVIHTNSGVYGKLESCGTVDFFMNNGQFQVITALINQRFVNSSAFSLSLSSPAVLKQKVWQ